METVKRLFISLIVLLGCTAGAWSQGVLPGLFSVNASGDKVQFSQGNLQYFCSTTAPEWRFAEHQYDYVAFDISAYTENSGKWIDLFAHGTSGYNNAQNYYQPYVVGASPGTYYQGNLTGNADWGYNAISNGGNTENSGWRTPTRDEWVYLLSGRSNADSKYGQGSINGVNGLILLPDDWSLPDGLNFTPRTSAWTNSYTTEQWALMESAGAVFLPASGSCNSAGIPPESTQNLNGFYRTSTAAYYLYFSSNNLQNCSASYYQYGDAVRLVKDVKLEMDDEGYYLIGSVTDWKRFAAIVNSGTDPAANAKMIADVDLGDDQTMIGTSSMKYQGTFDGQAHTLTVNYSGSSKQFIAPFHYVDGGTILNLRIDGIVSSSSEHLSGLIGKAYNEITIENCLVAAEIKMNSDYAGGFVGNGGSQMYNDPSKVVFKNCLFAGTFTGVGGSRNTAAGFYGWGKSTPVFINCLENGTYNNVSGYNPYMYEGTDRDNTETTANSYYKHGNINLEGISDASAMTDGEIVSNLGDAWVIDGILNMPMLKIFSKLAKDEDGYYLIGSVENWKYFAAIVNDGTDPAANAKMIADVDLGDDQTMVGSESVPYQGTFDGDGNKLTIAYDVTENYVAPFRVVNGATIQNLEVDGTINTTAEYAGGIIGYSPSSSTASNVKMCRSSVSIVGHSSLSDRTDWHGGFVGLVYTPVHFTDCLSDGKITGSSSPARSYCTGFIGLARGGTSIFTNCLNNCELSVYATNGLWHFIGGTGSVTNSYVNNTISYTAGYSQAAPVSGEQISNGTVSAMLQNNREEEIWVQDPVLGTPMLKLFANDLTYIVPSSGIGTFSAKGQVLLPEGLKAYYCKTYHKKNSTISVVGISGNIVPAATGVLLVGNKGETFTLTGACGQAPTITDNELMAVTESKHIPATNGEYTNFMMKGGKFIKIADDNASMPANRAYLPLLTTAISGSNAKEITLYWDDEEATGIERMRNVENEIMRNGNIYNLNGQKLSAPQKGINIINGRKVIVK